MSKVQTPLDTPVDGKELLHEIKRFQRESLAGTYYAPFNMNSKNSIGSFPQRPKPGSIAWANCSLTVSS
jgi:hypothetical protein